jgi:hypothetical protein
MWRGINKMMNDLKQVDPETYNRFYRCVNCNANSHKIEESVLREILRDEIHKAIVSREDSNGTGWVCQISTRNDFGKYLAIISRSNDEELDGVERYLGEGYSPAEALLSAYLTAFNVRKMPANT